MNDYADLNNGKTPLTKRELPDIDKSLTVPSSPSPRKNPETKPPPKKPEDS